MLFLLLCFDNNMRTGVSHLRMGWAVSNLDGQGRLELEITIQANFASSKHGITS